jgi:hypothetical protein
VIVTDEVVLAALGKAFDDEARQPGLWALLSPLERALHLKLGGHAMRRVLEAAADASPAPSEVLAVERIHTWVYADEDRSVVIEKDGMDIAVHFCGAGGGNDVDAILANAVLGVELVEEADDAR